MVNKKHMEEWVEALESGAFQQAKETLAIKDDTGSMYCCLGVACELAERDGVAHDWYNDVVESETLPRPVQEWLGVNDTDPMVYTGWDRPRDTRTEHLTTLNDGLAWTFPMIAKAIRETYLNDA